MKRFLVLAVALAFAAAPGVRAAWPSYDLSSVERFLATLRPPTTTPATVKAPRRVMSYGELAKLLKSRVPSYTYQVKSGGLPTADLGVNGAPTSNPGSAAPEHSETNVQVAGVDEADFVKCDGTAIYQVRHRHLTISRATPASQLEVLADVDLGETFWPSELYVDGDRLVLIGMGWEELATAPPVAKPVFTVGFAADVWRPTTRDFVKVLVYDITDPAQPVVVREIRVEGSYLTSRKVDGSVHIVARNYPYFLYSASRYPSWKTPPGDTMVPSFSDSLTGGRWKALAATQIYYFPDFVEPDYMVVASFSLDKPQQNADIKSYLGAGEIVYASRQNLYISAATRDRFWVSPPVAIALRADTAPANVESTRLYKFKLLDGAVEPSVSGLVPGTLLNQFSLDEAGDTLRVATTFHAWWNATGQDSNNLYTLDANLNLIGRLEGIAPGELIYAARFLGDRCYLVTFQTIDPLFVIDLSNPAAPTILGELKIPGFSNYLHPVDATHLLGFGKDVVVSDAATVPGDELWWAGVPFFQGVKVALFDVSDVTRPVELDSMVIGDRGTDSELLWDHKALLFNADTGLLAFPITVAEIPEAEKPAPPWQYGQAVFQGAYVLSVSAADGLSLRGRISQMNAGVNPYEQWHLMVRRVLTIGDALYTVSNGGITANATETLEPLGWLELPPTDDVWHILPVDGGPAWNP